jgi:hypothetical protein
MHRLIAERAGHTAVAASMMFVDHSEVELERLKAERELERKRGGGHGGDGGNGTTYKGETEKRRRTESL